MMGDVMNLVKAAIPAAQAAIPVAQDGMQLAGGAMGSMGSS
jgi:hypothetical protein